MTRNWGLLRLAGALFAILFASVLFAQVALAGTPTGISASSTLPADSVSSYEVGNLIDGNNTTAWVEGVAGNGEGESIVYYYPAGTLVRGMTIQPGYWKSEALFYANAAPTRVVVSTGGSQYECDIPDIAPTFRTSGDYSYVDYNGYQGYSITFPQPLVSDGAVRVTIVSVRPGNAYEDTCITELSFSTAEQTFDGSRTVTVEDTAAARLALQASYLYMFEVSRTDLYPVDVAVSNASPSAKALLVYEYQYHVDDPRIMDGPDLTVNAITDEGLRGIVTDLFGYPDQAVLDAFAQGGYVRSYESGVYYVNATGDFGDAGMLRFETPTLLGIQDGRTVFSGVVSKYDPGAGQYGSYVPVATYVMYAVENPAGLQPAWRLDELVVSTDGAADVVPASTYNEYAYEEPAGYSLDQLCEMAAAYYARDHAELPEYVVAEYADDGSVAIHLYNVVGSDGEEHTGTLMWYFVDEYGVGTDIVGYPVDLRG